MNTPHDMADNVETIARDQLSAEHILRRDYTMLMEAAAWIRANAGVTVPPDSRPPLTWDRP